MSQAIPIVYAASRETKAPPWWWKILSSFWLHLLLVTATCFAYNRAIENYDLELSRKSGGFDPAIAPLYARLSAMATYDPAEQNSWLSLWRIAAEKIRNLKLVLPPVVIFLVWIVLALCQLKLWRIPAWLWIIASVVFVLLINVTVNSMDGGKQALFAPFSRVDMEYYGDVRKVNTLEEFWHDYPQYNREHYITHHAGTHPPGGVTFLYLIGRYFDDSVETASWAAIIVSALSVIPVYLLARRLYGQDAAVIASALWALTPNLVLFGATSMDGVFALFPILALWLFIKAVRDRPIIYGLLFGLAMTLGLLMTFATICIGIFTIVYGALALLLRPRSFLTILMVNVIGATIIAVSHAILYKWIGYDIVETIRAALERNQSVMGSGRETLERYLDISFANLFAFLIGTGLIATTLWLRQFGRALGDGFRRRGWDLFALSFLPALLIISFSNLFTFEVERIWLFLVPLVVVPGAANLMSAYTSRPRWVLLHAALILLFAQTWLTQLLFFTYW